MVKKDDNKAIVFIVLIGLLAIVFIPVLFYSGLLNPYSFSESKRVPLECKDNYYFTVKNFSATASELNIELINGNYSVRINNIAIRSIKEDIPIVYIEPGNEFVNPNEEFTIKAVGLSLSTGYYDAMYIFIPYTLLGIEGIDIINFSDTLDCRGVIIQ